MAFRTPSPRDQFEKPIPYFPTADSPHRGLPENLSILNTPQEIGPILDPQRFKEPLRPFSEEACEANYGPENEQQPPPPPNFQDSYLQPTLAHNERLRLTLLWYYTRETLQDPLLRHMLEERVKMANDVIGWGCAIVGLVDNNVYTRLATTEVPLAKLPRRETTCAHTICQPCGQSVFQVPNVKNDWRFKNSPHVVTGNLYSYAGTQLRCRARHGQDVAIGSLYVASETEQEPLRPEQQTFMVRFADIIADEIVHAAQLKRQQARQEMGDVVTRLRTNSDSTHAMENVLEAVRQFYPKARIDLQDSEDDLIGLPGRMPIQYSEFLGGLWEDSQFLDELIQNHNHEDLRTKRTVRAIAAGGESHVAEFYLVVASTDVSHVFDDVDALFISRCAGILNNVRQERSLQEAMHAKEVFLRNITHQLRTPLHGILGSCELLTEELRALKVIEKLRTREDGVVVKPSPTNAATFLSTIKTSGRELMATVNNMLMLNRWAEISSSPQPSMIYDFTHLEAEMVERIIQFVTDDDLANISIFIENKLPPECEAMATDKTLFKQCIYGLTLNAIQYTQTGIVLISLSVDADHTALCIDVEDTGCGIHEDDQKRIFTAYEKGASHTKGAGLGLTLSSKIASFLGGSMHLISSKPGKGSHFRVEFPNAKFSVQPSSKPTSQTWESIPKTFHIIAPQTAPRTHSTSLGQYFARHLQRRGFNMSENFEGSLVVIDSTSDTEHFERCLQDLKPHQVAICVVPADDDIEHLQKNTQRHYVVYASGPFTTFRLDDILEHVNECFRSINPKSGPDEVVYPGTVDIEHPLEVAVKNCALTEGITPFSLSHSASLEQNHVQSHSQSPSQSRGQDRGLERSQSEGPLKNLAPIPKRVELPAPNRSHQFANPTYLSPDPSSATSVAEMRAYPPVALLVDDNAINLRIVEMYCTKRKIPFVTANNGREAVNLYTLSLEPAGSSVNPALKALKNQPINIILMDLQMPVMDGATATQHIRDLEKKNRAAILENNNNGPPDVVTVPPPPDPAVIFIVTGQDNFADRERSSDVGADQFYVKPVGMNALDRGLKEYFAGFEGKLALR